jgi:rod shape-determining protein MreC
LSFPRSQYLTSTSSISGTIFEMKHDLTKFLDLEENNTSLQKENLALRSRTIENLFRLDNGLVKVDDTLHKVQYEYVPGEIINSTHTKRNNFFTISVGSDQGIKRNMGVFSSNGVVGVIHFAGPKYSIVKSCLTEKLNIAVMIEVSGEHGFLQWDGKDSRRGTLTGISNDSDVVKWSKVVTRGSAGIFPEGIAVGKVEKSNVVEGMPLWDVTILFSENYRTVQRVYVVKNLLKEEQDDAESHIPVDPKL